MDDEQLEIILTTLEDSQESAAISVAEHIRTVAANGPEYSTRAALLEEAESLGGWAQMFAKLVREQL